MICQKCGNQISNNYSSCPYCGYPTVNNAAFSVQQQNNYAPQQNNYAPQQNNYAPQQNNYAPQQNYYAPQNQQYAPYGAQQGNMQIIQQYDQKANTMRILGIVAAVLMFGIGICFSVAIWVMMSTNKAPEIMTSDPQEIAALEEAKKKSKLAFILSFLPVAALVLSFILGIFIGLFSVMM